MSAWTKSAAYSWPHSSLLLATFKGPNSSARGFSECALRIYHAPLPQQAVCPPAIPCRPCPPCPTRPAHLANGLRWQRLPPSAYSPRPPGLCPAGTQCGSPCPVWAPPAMCRPLSLPVTHVPWPWPPAAPAPPSCPPGPPLAPPAPPPTTDRRPPPAPCSAWGRLKGKGKDIECYFTTLKQCRGSGTGGRRGLVDGHGPGRVASPAERTCRARTWHS